MELSGRNAVCFFLSWDWSLNTELHKDFKGLAKEALYCLSHTSGPLFWEYTNYLPWLASNHDSPDLSLLIS
jgi:hypothetical protein